MSFRDERKFPFDFLECIEPTTHIMRSDLALLLRYKADVSGATTKYYGWSLPGTSVSASAWLIRKDTLNANGETTATDVATNSSKPNQVFIGVWDDRASETFPS